MRIGLVSYRCENQNIEFNMKQIGLSMQRSVGKADLLCFGEAFLQGFDSLCWEYESDKAIALTFVRNDFPITGLDNAVRHFFNYGIYRKG